jgi:gentisate 1,2-dioxygenase
MSLQAGDLLTYHDYLSQTLRRRESPAHWPWAEVRKLLDKQAGSDQGTLAMSRDDANDPATVAPGISLVVQRIRPGELTSSHQHSFWHLYWVCEGEGIILTGSRPDKAQLNVGDVLFVPAWCPHALDNRSGKADLVLIRLQNLPQNVGSGTLMREDSEGVPRPLYLADITDATGASAQKNTVGAKT